MTKIKTHVKTIKTIVTPTHHDDIFCLNAAAAKARPYIISILVFVLVNGV